MSKEINDFNDANDKNESIEVNQLDGDRHEEENILTKEKTEIIQDNINCKDTDNTKVIDNDSNEEIYSDSKKNKCEDDVNGIKAKISKKTKNIIIIASTIILIGAIFIGKTVSNYENKIFPGTFIYKYDVSNLNKDEFLIKVKEVEKNIADKKINIITEKQDYTISIKELVGQYNNNKLYNEIIKKQDEENIISKFVSIVSKKNIEYSLDMDVDKDVFDKLKDDIAQNINIECTEPKVVINQDKISYEEGKSGLKLDDKSLYDDLNKSINDKNLIKDNISLKANLVEDSPKIKIEELKSINKKISTYTTTYGSGNARGSNVENAASKIDDLLLMPGEEFSYENTVGPVVASNGYKYAPVISNGQLVDGIGGGVCQVSSTLYNTQLNAGILPTERRNHSKPVSYVPRGLDATLASGSIDYKFKNTYDYPLVINTEAANGRLTIEIWSNENALKGLEYKPVSYASGNVANTYLYGYDKNGKKVYEKHIDTSVYR